MSWLYCLRGTFSIRYHGNGISKFTEDCITLVNRYNFKSDYSETIDYNIFWNDMNILIPDRTGHMLIDTCNPIKYLQYVNKYEIDEIEKQLDCNNLILFNENFAYNEIKFNDLIIKFNE